MPASTEISLTPITDPVFDTRGAGQHQVARMAGSNFFWSTTETSVELWWSDVNQPVLVPEEAAQQPDASDFFYTTATLSPQQWYPVLPQPLFVVPHETPSDQFFTHSSSTLENWWSPTSQPVILGPLPPPSEQFFTWSEIIPSLPQDIQSLGVTIEQVGVFGVTIEQIGEFEVER